MAKKDWVALYGNKSQSTKPKKDWINLYGQKAHEKRKGLSGIGKDIKETLAEAPGNLFEGLGQLPGELKGAFDQLTDISPKRRFQNIVGGLGELGHGVLSLPGNIRDYLAKKEVIPEGTPSFRLPESILPREFNYAEALGREGERPGDTLISSLPGMAAFGALGEAGPARGLLTRGAQRAGAQGAFGAGQNENPLQAALTQAILGSAAHGASKLAPSRLFRGTLSPEELARNAEVTKGTETNLGQVIGSPTLNRIYENILPHIIGSGAEKTMQRTADEITKRGHKLLEKTHGDIEPGEYGEKIQQALKTSFNEVKAQKTANFKKVDEQAEKLGVKTERSNLRNEAEQILNEVNEDADLRRFMDSGDINLLQSLAPKKKANVGSEPETVFDYATGKQRKIVPEKNAEKPEEFSLKKTDILRGKIGEHAHEANIKGEKPKSAIYTRLKQALEKDVDQAIEQSGSDELRNLRSQAMEHYKKEFAPFEDPDIVKFTKKGGDPDVILSHFVRTGQNDRVRLAQKLSQSLGSQQPQEGNLLTSAYFSKALDEEGKLNPVKLRTLYNKLGKKQRELLFGDKKLHKEFKDYADLVAKNIEPFNLMFNPKTGARNTELLTKLGQIVGGGLVGGGSLSGFGASLAGGAAGARGLTKLLSSEKVRTKLIDKMLANDKAKGMPKKGGYADKLAKALIANQGNQQTPEQMQLELIKRIGK